jgi:FlaA1/EpsC-like NDP-sugar epimerase
MTGSPLPFSQEELLGRPAPGPLDLAGVEEQIAGRRVAVTGAAGSVGTPLARLLLDLRPAELLLIDHHEQSLFRLRQALGPSPAAPVRWALADVRDRRKLDRLFRAGPPDVVFHLAAYKHVPLGEENPDQTVDVNLAGIRAMIETSAEHGATRFVYPSSDKAVSPPSLYGATKKIAEALTLAAGEQFATGLSVARFVNIVGTRGSVIETFCAQVAAGEPLTLTDPGMTRYWITMPEAVRLLLRTACHPDSGAVFLPDSGPAVNLAEMAAHLARLLAPDRPDYPIRFIGMRPGERMHEILLSHTETAEQSEYPGILRVRSSRPPLPGYSSLSGAVDELLEVAFSGDDGAIRARALEMANALQ